ncbi:MAG: C45 family autoproteolytic acyltransferase/hydrolase [Candidatus Edwardsbacteria bacterium]|jgi:hypothetical protein|nr:C45 family autoproteolytic acyltransferase/hydrolase [Candidatus Edwardsbacteria bacterium]
MRSIALLTLIIAGAVAAQPVTVTDQGTYYEVIADYGCGVTPDSMGRALVAAVRQAVPNFEPLVDSYLAEKTGSNSVYNAWLARMADIRPQLAADHAAEIEGMASQVSGGTSNARGDGKLSRDELFLLNLFPDVARGSQCCGLSVWGARSASGRPMTARLLDWSDGSAHQLSQIQAVTTIMNSSSSVCLIGYLGFLGAITGFNDDGLFAGILDSPSGAAYSSSGKRSYPFDIRSALEDLGSIAAAADYLSDTAKHYAYNHLVLLCDSAQGGVLENNFSGSGTNVHRALRRDSSALNPGVSWPHGDAVAAVNSFVLAGNVDNHTPYWQNYGRWHSFDSLLAAAGTVDRDELRLIAGFDNGNGPGTEYGDLYVSSNQQIVLFRPDSMGLEIAFRPRSGILPADPLFEQVAVHIGPSAGVAVVSRPLPVAPAIALRSEPNPFRGSAMISYQTPAAGHVSLRVYNIGGQLVRTLVDGPRPAGRHTVRWDGRGDGGLALASATYICLLTAGGRTAAARTTLLR